jgi:hypothetical protein
VLNIGASNIFEHLLHAGCQVLRFERAGQSLFDGLHRRPIKNTALIQDAAIFAGNETFQDIGIERFAVSGQTGNFPFMAMCFEAADMSDVSVVVTERIETVDVA